MKRVLAFWRRLAVRIYALGALQLVAVAISVVVTLGTIGPPSDLVAGVSELAVNDLASHIEDPVATQASLARIRRTIQADITLYDEKGAVLASSGPPIPRPTAADEPSWSRSSATILLPWRTDAKSGSAVVRPRRPSGAPLGVATATALLVLAASALLLARSLARPLAQLATAARRIGAGELGTRVVVRPGDEIAELADAFNEMSDKVAALLRAERALLADVSHELRTPLARLRVAVELAADGDPARIQSRLADTVADLDELERLVEDVLEAARFDHVALGPHAEASGLPPLRMAELDLDELLREAAARFRSTHPRHQLVIEAAGRTTVWGDRVLLRRAIDNVLDNAGKYSGETDGAIVLRTRLQDDAIAV